MSMFGWSMGDIITLSGLAVQVYTAYKDAPDEYKHISNEVKSLQILIDKAVPYCKSTSLNNNSRQEGQQALKGCNDVLEDLNSLIEKYNSSGSSRTSQVLKRIRLGTEDIASLRVRLISNTALLNSFVQSYECREIREVQERILALHRTTSKSSSISFSSFARSINTKMAYKRLCKNLFQMGVTSDMIEQKEGEILNIFNESQDTAASDERNDGSQLLRPNLNQPRFRLPIDFLVGPRMLAAATAGDTQRFISTLEYIRNIDFNDNQKETALHKAVGGGHMDIMELLLEKGASTEATNTSNNTPLHLAIRGRDTGLVELLLQKGASTEATDNGNNTPLDLAVRCGDLSMAELLFKKGALIEAMCGDNINTLLHLAAKNGHTSTVGLLVEKGASMESTGRDEKAPMHLAAMNGYTSTVELLLEKGASKEAKARGRTPLHLAARSGHTSTVELLLEKGASVGANSYNKYTPLHLAAYNGHTSTVELLLEKDACIEAKGWDSRTPLHLAAYNGRTSMVELLLKKGAWIEAKDRDSRTSLHLAAIMGRTSTIELLLENGALISTRNIFGCTPSDDAVYHGYTAPVILLEKEAAKRATYGNHA